jgi:hypothetical protein
VRSGHYHPDRTVFRQSSFQAWASLAAFVQSYTEQAQTIVRELAHSMTSIRSDNFGGRAGGIKKAQNGIFFKVAAEFSSFCVSKRNERRVP